MNEFEQPIRIILADDHEIFREGFSVMFLKNPEISLVSTAADGDDLINKVKLYKPDVVITDIKMPHTDGIKATREITAEFPGIGIIALSMFGEEDLIVDMLEAGAKGYLIKNASKQEILTAIKTVHQGLSYYCRQTTQTLTHLIAHSNYNPDLRKTKPVFSEKEIAIIKLICKQYSNREIAEYMQLSSRTVEGYREKILNKIEAKNTAGIVIYAIRNKIF